MTEGGACIELTKPSFEQRISMTSLSKPAVAMILAVLAVRPVAAASLSEVPDDEITWCTLEFAGGIEIRGAKGEPSDPLGIVLKEVADAQPGTELFLELEFGDGQKRSYTGAVDDHDEVPVFQAPMALLSDLTKEARWTYRLDQRQSVEVDETLSEDLKKGFERCLSEE